MKRVGLPQEYCLCKELVLEASVGLEGLQVARSVRTGQLHYWRQNGQSVDVADAQVPVSATDGVRPSVEETLEGVPELGAEDGVDDRVQGRVKVP